MAKFVATTNPEISEREIRHGNMVREMAAECMVLLENDGTLPLKKTGKLALYGNGARRTVKGGTGSGDVNVRESVTIEQGLERAGFEITTKAWMDRMDQAADDEQAARLEVIRKEAEARGMDPFMLMILTPFSPVAMARITEEDVKNSDTDTAVYVIGRNSGEGADRNTAGGDYTLSDAEIANIQMVASHYAKTIVLLNIGGVIDTKVLRNTEGLNAVVLSGQLGNIGGLAVADLLLGKAIPTGKLSDTWAENYSDYSSAEGFSANDGDTDDEYYTEGIFTGYRYFDTFNVTPAYCFGYGKTYTDFSIEATKTSVNGTQIDVTVKVTNIGSEYAGKEVVQVYVSAPAGSLEKPYQELAGFAKTKELAPGESQELTISVKITSLSSYSEEKAAWMLEAGTYYVRVGNSSRNTKVVLKAVLPETIITEQCKNMFADPEGKLEVLSAKDAVPYSYPEEEAEKAAAPEAVIDPALFETVIHSYTEAHETLTDAAPGHVITMDEVLEGKYTINDLTAQLTEEEMTYLCVGNSAAIKDESVVGNASLNLPGSAGETSAIVLESRNVQQIQLPDGPAGLRLAPVFVELPDGGYVNIQSSFGTAIENVENIEGVRHYQYCTAIPIAMALASSWNMELIETCGDIVGAEMDEFKATLWLAPGMNNHRNPLCGRNFEYYSEDPLLSGLCAAADTRGVQKHPGTGTTIKHYAANSQENNRMGSNAHIGERAVREIYIKSFEITCKESQPMAIMSSYNLLNGTHTANHMDLLTYAARDEWGYKGLVMTDWMTTSTMNFSADGGTGKYEHSSPAQCIRTGNDLIMPGGQWDIDGIHEGIVSGEITMGDLQTCAARILTIISKSALYEGAVSYNKEVPGKNVTFTVE